MVTSPYVFDKPCSDTVLDANNNQVRQTTFTYSPTGNLTQTSRWVSTTNGTPTYLTSSATYGSNGVLSSVKDVNQATTNYTDFVCNGMLPKTINYPLSLTSSQTWDSTCEGGVPESRTDANQNPTTYGYGDPLWRMKSATDQNYPATNLSYLDATHFESSMNFNGSVSTVDTTTATDGLGRPILVQKKQAQGSSSFDSVQYQYGWNATGAFMKQSLPYSGSPVAWTTTQYDAVGRVSTVTDGGGNTVTTYTYNGKDVLIDVTAPSGENHKKRQLEYDGLGRLTSVCEITAGSTTGCTQSNPIANGYWTQYARGTNTLTVTQNSLGSTTETRNYYYDDWADSLRKLIAKTGRHNTSGMRPRRSVTTTWAGRRPVTWVRS
jgi:YD repeat-containing protein